MQDIIPAAIDAYALSHSSDADPIFDEIERYTNEKTKNPQMLSGRLVGLTLHLLASLVRARRALEFGTFTGYSALWVASALPEDGRLITCDVDAATSAVARSFWDRSPHGRRIELKLGPGIETAKGLGGQFDFVFIDADKPGYPAYYQRSMELLAPGGIIVLDNMLYYSQVLKPETEGAKAIVRTAEMIKADRRAESVLLTVRDGLMVVRKKG